jgi:hypothetical protein
VCLCLQKGGFAAHGADAGLRYHRHGHRPAGLLPERRVGHHAGAGRAQRKVLQLLRGALSGHNFQHHPPQKDFVLHGEPYNSLCRHFIPLGARLLPTLGFRREGQSNSQKKKKKLVQNKFFPKVMQKEIYIFFLNALKVFLTVTFLFYLCKQRRKLVQNRTISTLLLRIHLSMCQNVFSCGTHVQNLWICPSGVTLHLHPAVSDRVLPAAGRNHSADLAHSAPLGQVPALHHGAGHALRRGHHCGAQR